MFMTNLPFYAQVANMVAAILVNHKGRMLDHVEKFKGGSRSRSPKPRYDGNIFLTILPLYYRYIFTYVGNLIPGLEMNTGRIGVRGGEVATEAETCIR